ncbi:hypothetical protein WA171_006983 [Blastocystis sp. BT1]
MSARVFASLPKQFARAARFQKMKSPSINPNIAFQFMKRPSSLMTRRMALRLQTCEMQRLQIGALFMFTRVSQEIIEMMRKYQEMLDDEDQLDEDEQTTVTTRSLTSSL